MELVLEYPPVPEHASDLARLAVAAARDISEVDLDYTPASLDLLDQLVGSFTDEVALEDFAATLFCFGCYLGEVMIRNVGGRWIDVRDSPMGDYSRWPIVIQVDSGYHWNPIGKVFKRFDLGEGESLAHFFSSAKAASR